jgi:1-phosphatidylinositol-3-phosphate 5-kinase
LGKILGNVSFNYRDIPKLANLCLRILYTNVLHPLTCSHMSTGSANVLYKMRTPALIARIHIETVSVLDTRLPKLQVGPIVSKRKAGTTVAILEGLTRKDMREKEKEILRGEIKAVFEELKQKVLDVSKEVDSKEPSSTASKEGSAVDVDTTQSALMIRLEEAERHICEKLDASGAGQLNDSRLALSDLIGTLLSEIADWRRSRKVGDDLECSTVPEYTKPGKVHALPGSSVLVREDEPSSIVAYTLS